jgi:hypothetical protein
MTNIMKMIKTHTFASVPPILGPVAELLPHLFEWRHVWDCQGRSLRSPSKNSKFSSPLKKIGKKVASDNLIVNAQGARARGVNCDILLLRRA